MKKLITSAVLSAGLLLSGFAAAPDTVQAKEHHYLDNGISVKGRTMLPMRDLFETIDATVHWDQKTKTVSAARGGKKIALKIGSKKATVNGKALSLDVPAVVIDGSTYVPVRFAAESLGATADYKPEWREAYLTLPDTEVTISVSPAYNVGGLDTKFRPNPSYVYKFIPYEGTETLSFVGMRGSNYVWKSVYQYVEKSPASYVTYKETKDGLYTINSNNTAVRQIKYPVYVGQTWTDKINGEYVTSKIVSTGFRYNTEAHNFMNVIEILDSDGYYTYYAVDYGFVGLKHKDYDYVWELVGFWKK